MPSDLWFEACSDHMSLRLSSSRHTRRKEAEDHCCHSIDALAYRINGAWFGCFGDKGESANEFIELVDHAKLLASKTASTSIFLDQLPSDDDDHGYKAMILSKDKSGERKVLLEGEYTFSSSKGEAKRKALEALLKKSGEKVKEAIDKPKVVVPGGRWVFVPE